MESTKCTGYGRKKPGILRPMGVRGGSAGRGKDLKRRANNAEEN